MSTCVCHVCVCVCVCVRTTHPDFGLPVQDRQEDVQEVCIEDWLVVGSKVNATRATRHTHSEEEGEDTP